MILSLHVILRRAMRAEGSPDLVKGFFGASTHSLPIRAAARTAPECLYNLPQDDMLYVILNRHRR